jgi:hypothetical protein
MPSSEPRYGEVLNREEVTDRKTGPVAVSITLAVGLVYQDGVNGWKNATSQSGEDVYWNETEIVSTATLGEKVGTFFGSGAIVVGKSDGIITANARVKNGTVANAFVANTVTLIADQLLTCGRYLGHPQERTGNETLPTSSADLETNCVFVIERG